MELKKGKVYANRWVVDNDSPKPMLSGTTYRVYWGKEAEHGDSVLSGRPSVLKVCRYSDASGELEIVQRRKTLEYQLKVLALEHFMLPEPLDFCYIENKHNPEISGTYLQSTEPLLVYAYSPGQTLRDLISPAPKEKSTWLPIKPLKPLDALSILQKIIDFLYFLHEQGYGHAAVNPNHFIFHQDSIRSLGLSKIGRIDNKGMQLNLPEIPYLGRWEGAFLPREAWAKREFNLGTEYYQLAVLFLYLTTGVSPSESVHVSSSRQLKTLDICDELQNLMAFWLDNWRQPYDNRVEESYIRKFQEAQIAQLQYQSSSKLRTAKVGIFLDFENIYHSLVSDRLLNSEQFPIDFEAISFAYQNAGPIYRCTVIPHRRLEDTRIRSAVEELKRSGWDILVLGGSGQQLEEATNGMDENDDALLIQTANKYLETAQKPEQLVIIANDRDYRQLIGKATLRKVDTTVILSRSQLVNRSSISQEYINSLNEKKIQVHTLGSYPYVFGEESYEVLKDLGFSRRLPVAFAHRYKSLIWAFHYETGRIESQKFLLALIDELETTTYKNGHKKNASIIDVFFPLKHIEKEFHPFIAKRLLKSKKPAKEISYLQERIKLLEPFGPYNDELLEKVYQKIGQNSALVRKLGQAPANIASHWNFLQGHLNHQGIIELFAQPGTILDPELIALVKKEPDAYLQIAEEINSEEFPVLLASFGIKAYVAIRRYKSYGLEAIRKFGQDGLNLLSGNTADQLIEAISDKAMLQVLEDEYRHGGKLESAVYLVTKPELHVRLNRVGTENRRVIFDIYREQANLAVLDEVISLSQKSQVRLDIAYNAWLEWKSRNLPISQLIESVEIAIQGDPLIFGKNPVLDVYKHHLAIIYQAWINGDLTNLTTLSVVVGSPALLAYEKFGGEIIPIARNTSPTMISWLNAFPELLPILRRFGDKIVPFIQKYKKKGCQVLVELRAFDLSPLLNNVLYLQITEAWFRYKGDLDGFSVMVRQPVLLNIIQGWCKLKGNDPMQGVEVLKLYLSDPDLGRLHAALYMSLQFNVSAEEMLALLTALEWPIETVRTIFSKNGKQILSLKTVDLRMRAARIFLKTNSSGQDVDFADLLENRKQNAIDIYERHGEYSLRLHHLMGVKAIDLIEDHPNSISLLQNHGIEAFQFIMNFDAYEIVTVLNNLSLQDQHLVINVLDHASIYAWWSVKRNLVIISLLVEHPQLQDLIKTCGLGIVDLWIEFREHHSYSAFNKFEQVVDILLDQTYEPKILIPLAVLPVTIFRGLVQNFYHEIIKFDEVEFRLRLAKVLTEELGSNFQENGRRYFELSNTLDRRMLLITAERGGESVISLIEALQSTSRIELVRTVASFKEHSQARSYLELMKRHQGWVTSAREPVQTEIIRATWFLPISQVYEAWRQYGDQVLNEIITHRGKISIEFKIKLGFRKLFG